MHLPSTLQLSNELKQHVTQTLSEKYGQPGAREITASVDRLQQDVSPRQGGVPSVPSVCVPRASSLPLSTPTGPQAMISFDKRV